MAAGGSSSVATAMEAVGGSGSKTAAPLGGSLAAAEVGARYAEAASGGTTRWSWVADYFEEEAPERQVVSNK